MLQVVRTTPLDMDVTKHVASASTDINVILSQESVIQDAHLNITSHKMANAKHVRK